MHKSFTLMEVVIAVIILALVGTALLKNSSDGIEFIQKISQKNQAIDAIAIVANHRNPSFNHLQKSLEDFLQDSYHIDDMDVQKIIKNKKFKYLENYLKIEMPILEGFEEEPQESIQENENIIPLRVVKLSIQNREKGDYLYILELNE